MRARPEGVGEDDVRISIQSADPGVSMCVYHHGTSAHLSECFFEEESCAPSCTPYTVFISNG